MSTITTERLLLRPWQPEDGPAYFAINQDPKVLEFLPGPLTHEYIEKFMALQNQQLQEKGYTLWAVELKDSGDFIGFVGLNYVAPTFDFAPAVEIGWRLGSQYWGFGYATEAAKAALAYGFDHCQLEEIVSFTVTDNNRSRNVMSRLGMEQDLQGDFSHPKLPKEHRLSKHVLYRIRKEK